MRGKPRDLPPPLLDHEGKRVIPTRAMYIEKQHVKGEPLLKELITHGLNMGHLV